jgi:hypothetical protein
MPEPTAHVVMVMADSSDYPSRAFESLIEAKAFAMGKQEQSGTRVYVTSVPFVRAGRCQGCEDAPVGMTVIHDVNCERLTPADLKTMVMQDDDEPMCAQETAGFGPPCSDPMCEACRG